MNVETQLKAKLCWALVILFCMRWKTIENVLNNGGQQVASWATLL